MRNVPTVTASAMRALILRREGAAPQECGDIGPQVRNVLCDLFELFGSGGHIRIGQCLFYLGDASIKIPLAFLLQSLLQIKPA